MSYPSVKRSARKAAGFVIALGTLLTLTGCWVTSINPLYEDGAAISVKDPDVVFEPSLLGSWTVSDKCTAPLIITSKDNGTYELDRKAEGDGCTESDKPTHLQGRLVKLDAYYFFDMFPRDEDVCSMCLPQHNIFLTKFDKINFSLTPIDSDWLKKAIATKKVKLATLAGDTDTITASSKELKAFCRKFAADKEVFKPDPSNTDTLTRK